MQSKSFTKLFASITDSSIWSEDNATRIVWITMLAMADSSGYVGASILGLAARARVSVPECEKALAKFMAPDPYSRTRDHDGRRVMLDDGGWTLVNYKRHRDVARDESVKESKRLWAARARARQLNEVEESRTAILPVEVESNSPSASSSSGSDLDLDLTRASPTPAQGQPHVWFTLAGWEISESLRAEAVIAGVPPADIDKRIKELKNGPIGGRRGVIDRDDYVRGLFGKWRTWAETDRAKAVSGAAKAPSRGFQSRNALPALEADERHREFARRHGIDVDAIVADIERKGLPETLGMGRARELIGEALTKAARARAKAAGVTP